MVVPHGTGNSIIYHKSQRISNGKFKNKISPVRNPEIRNIPACPFKISGILSYFGKIAKTLAGAPVPFFICIGMA